MSVAIGGTWTNTSRTRTSARHAEPRPGGEHTSASGLSVLDAGAALQLGESGRGPICQGRLRARLRRGSLELVVRDDALVVQPLLARGGRKGQFVSCGRGVVVGLRLPQFFEGRTSLDLGERGLRLGKVGSCEFDAVPLGRVVERRQQPPLLDEVSFPVEAVVQYIAAGLWGLLSWWMDARTHLSADNVSAAFRRLAIPAVKAAVRQS